MTRDEIIAMSRQIIAEHADEIKEEPPVVIEYSDEDDDFDEEHEYDGMYEKWVANGGHW